MTTSTTTVCVACGSAEGAHRQLLSGLLVGCASCGLAWTAANPEPPEELYGEDYFSGGAYEDYLRPDARRFEAGQRLRWLLHTGRVSSLVEAGCAGGFFVEAALRAGIAATGVELSAEMARYAHEQLGLPVRQGRFESTSLDTPVQAVCAFHVLEHVENPNAFIRTAWQLLAPGGLLALEVPNIDSTAANRLGLAWPGLQPRYHRWHFGATSLRRLVERSGFEVLTQDTATLRYYMPTRFRHRQAWHQLPADLRNTRSLRLTPRRRGDLLRLIAAKPHWTNRIARRKLA